MAVTEAQKRAAARYQKQSTTQVNLKFSPLEQDVYEWIKSRPGTASGYLKALARADMEARKNENSIA